MPAVWPIYRGLSSDTCAVSRTCYALYTGFGYDEYVERVLTMGEGEQQTEYGDQ